MKKTVAYKMAGFGTKSGHADTVLNKKDDKQVPLSAYEKKKGTEIIGGSKAERINDLEMRIEDLQSDLKEGKGDMAQLAILKARLAKERQADDK